MSQEIIVISKEELRILLEEIIKNHLQPATPAVYLNKNEAAKRLNVCYNTLMKYINKGWIKVNKHGRIPESEIIQFLNNKVN